MSCIFDIQLGKRKKKELEYEMVKSHFYQACNFLNYFKNLYAFSYVYYMEKRKQITPQKNVYKKSVV